jgi:hypothetical protein
MPHESRLLLLLALLLAVLRCSSAQESARLVSTPAEFVAALQDQRVSVLNITNDLLLSQQHWPLVPFVVTRSVLIRGGVSPAIYPLLDLDW